MFDPLMVASPSRASNSTTGIPAASIAARPVIRSPR